MGLIIWNGPCLSLFNRHFSNGKMFYYSLSRKRESGTTHIVGILRNANIVEKREESSPFFAALEIVNADDMGMGVCVYHWN